MSIKAKSFEGSAARKKRYEREARDLKREIAKIDGNIKFFREEIAREKHDLAEMKQELADAEAGKKVYKDDYETFLRIKIREAEEAAAMGVIDQHIAKAEAKKVPLAERLKDRQRWLEKH